MEIRTIGSASSGGRPAVDSGIVPQVAQNRASEQTSVQTANAVPQVAGAEQMGVTRKAADKVDVQQQPKDASWQANPDVSVRLASSQVKSETEKSRQAQRGRQERTAPLGEAEKEAEKARTRKVMDDISKSLASMQTNLDFSVDEDLGRVVVRIVDPETQELIKQLPSEEALALAKSLRKMTGMFVETSA
jgi:Uncharacterized flagellar protein FlaG